GLENHSANTDGAPRQARRSCRARCISLLRGSGVRDGSEHRHQRRAAHVLTRTRIGRTQRQNDSTQRSPRQSKPDFVFLGALFGAAGKKPRRGCRGSLCHFGGGQADSPANRLISLAGSPIFPRWSLAWSTFTKPHARNKKPASL